MKILYFVPYVPNLIRVRPFNLIRYLSELGNEVTVATLWTHEQERADIEKLKQYSSAVHAVPMPRWQSLWSCIKALPTSTPLQAVYSWQPALAQQLLGLAAGGAFDVIHIEHLRGSRYGLFLRDEMLKDGWRTPVVWDSVDCISLLFRWAAQQSRSPRSRMITRFEVGRTEKYERWLPGQFDHVLVTSPMDRQALLDLQPSPSAQISVLTNGVNLDYFTPGTEENRAPDTLVVSGKMSYHANVAMVMYLVKEIMPLVWRTRPSVRLQVVGMAPTREIQALGENPLITVISNVPDLPPYLQKASIALTPILYGVGVQNKVLEAMACATPVVATPQAVSALQARVGEDVYVAQTSGDYAAAILRLLADPQERQRLGRAGRSYVERDHQWLKIAGQLESIYHHQVRKIKANEN